VIPLLENHLWQSTVFALLAGLLTLALRKNHARTRHWVWLAASVKFLIPFSLLISAGSHLPWAHPTPAPPRLSTAIAQASEPFTSPVQFSFAPAEAHTSSSLLPAIWLCGFAGVVCFWFVRWRRVRMALRGAVTVDLGAPVRTMSSCVLMEPGVFGVFRPVLVLPEGITERLAPAQLRAVLAHEMCHVRFRDNLAAAVHMLVEATFWFHPLVWWIGTRLVEERERACDEEVLRQGSEPQAYAEGILNVCKFYLESPLACVSGITGADLKQRIEAIMTRRAVQTLGFGKKALLTSVSAIAAILPVGIGILNAPSSHAQSSGERLRFEVASIKANTSGDRGSYIRPSPGRLIITNMALRRMIMLAWRIQEFQIADAPGWIATAFYDVEAKTGSAVSVQQKEELMLRSLLEDRFGLRFHWETKTLPAYALTASRTGLKLQEAKPGSCIAIDPNNPPEHVAPEDRNRVCGAGWWGRDTLMMKHGDMAILANDLSYLLSRTVVDKTGLTGPYDVDLKFAPDQAIAGIPGPTGDAPPAGDAGPTIFTALQDQLGLRLEPAKAPVEILVIDRIERPSEN
jgi:bla regulator protein BlaR1